MGYRSPNSLGRGIVRGVCLSRSWEEGICMAVRCLPCSVWGKESISTWGIFEELVLDHDWQLVRDQLLFHIF